MAEWIGARGGRALSIDILPSTSMIRTPAQHTGFVILLHSGSARLDSVDGWGTLAACAAGSRRLDARMSVSIAKYILMSYAEGVDMRGDSKGYAECRSQYHRRLGSELIYTVLKMS